MYNTTLYIYTTYTYTDFSSFFTFTSWVENIRKANVNKFCIV